MEELTIDFINGFLDALSLGCSNVDYVPIYGAEQFSVINDDIRDSLKKHLNRDYSKRGDISNYHEIPNDKWKETLKEYIEKWVDKKYFHGQAHKLEELFENYKENYNEELEEFVFLFVGKNPKCFRVNIEHGDYGYDCEAIGFFGNEKAFYYYFSFSD